CAGRGSGGRGRRPRARWSPTILPPGGCARCTLAPHACSSSAAQYQPWVASRTTSGSGPALASSSDSATGSLSTRTVWSASPSPVMRTITERRRCRSIPTYCSPMGPPSSWLGGTARVSSPRVPSPGGGAAPSWHQDERLIVGFPGAVLTSRGLGLVVGLLPLLGWWRL